MINYPIEYLANWLFFGNFFGTSNTVPARVRSRSPFCQALVIGLFCEQNGVQRCEVYTDNSLSNCCIAGLGLFYLAITR